MGIALSQTDDSSLIRLEGAIDIGAAAELKAALLDAFAAGKAISVSAEAVSDFDITAYQLLWAAAREARRSGGHLAVAGQMPEPVRDALSGMGLDACALFE